MESWNLSTIYNLFRETVNEFLEDRAPRLGAALAFYTVFSLAPLLIIVITVAGLVFDPETVRSQLMTQFQGLIGADGAELISTMVAATREEHQRGIMATGLGLVLLLFGALGVFGQLQDAFNTIWEVQPREDAGIMRLVQQRLLSLTMVLGLSFLLIVSLVVSAFLASLGSLIGQILPGFDLLLTILNLAVSFGILTLLFGLMFKYVPDVEIPWNKVWIGAGMTALLFLIGQFLIGLYLGNTDVGSTFGAAGSLVVLLIWVYYSTQILFFGAEFTQVYTNKFGEGAQPSEDAEPVTEEARAQQGIPHRNGHRNGQEAEQAADQPEAPAAIGRASSRPVRYRTKTDATRKPAGNRSAAALFILVAGFGIGSLIGREIQKVDRNQ
jgi:membrane protein